MPEKQNLMQDQSSYFGIVSTQAHLDDSVWLDNRWMMIASVRKTQKPDANHETPNGREIDSFNR
jgi:hypothetical protein